MSLCLGSAMAALPPGSASVWNASSAVEGEHLPLRVRGTITAISNQSLTVEARDRRFYEIKLGPQTKYAEVIPYGLERIKVNDYLGSAVKGSSDNWVAVEVVVVPKSMQAGRKGAYPWDPLPDTSGENARDISGNASPSTEPEEVATTMTNGTVSRTISTAGSRTFLVHLAGSGSARIRVFSAAPVVRFVPCGVSLIHTGSEAVIWTMGGSATLVAVGNGVTPPM